MSDETNIVALPPTGSAALTTPITPQAMLAMAVSRGDMELAGKLMDFADRWEKAQNAKAFNGAIAAAKSEIKPIARNKTGHNSKKYADLAAAATAVDPILSAHGLGYRYRAKQGEKIEVTCIIFHRDGHQEEVTLSGPADKTGSKNDVQAIGSTLTYLQRYSLFLALGLAAGEDDDGNGGGNGSHVISDEQYRTLTKLIADVGADIDLFLKYFKAPSLADFPASQYPRAIDALNAKAKR